MQNYTVKYFDGEGISQQDVLLIKKPRTAVGLEKALAQAVGGKVVAYNLTSEYDKRYGMEETEFLKQAKELPLIAKKDDEVESEQ